jgi:hypothetical protein
MRHLANFLTALAMLIPAAAHASETRFVTADSIDVRLCPAITCPVTNRLYKRQQVEVFERRDGWARISREYDGAVEGLHGRRVARWVPAKHLSIERPAELVQPAPTADLVDPRIEFLPKVGDNGLTVADVTLLRRYAVSLLRSGACAAIDDGDRSVGMPGTYWVHCKGEPRNRFFRAEDVR